MNAEASTQCFAICYGRYSSVCVSLGYEPATLLPPLLLHARILRALAVRQTQLQGALFLA